MVLGQQNGRAIQLNFVRPLRFVVMFVANLPFQDAACEDDKCKGDLIVARYNRSEMKIKFQFATTVS